MSVEESLDAALRLAPRFIREFGRLLRDIIAFTVASRRMTLIVVVALAAAVAILSTTVATVGPVSLYPFI